MPVLFHLSNSYGMKHFISFDILINIFFMELNVCFTLQGHPETASLTNTIIFLSIYSRLIFFYFNIVGLL